MGVTVRNKGNLVSASLDTDLGELYAEFYPVSVGRYLEDMELELLELNNHGIPESAVPENVLQELTELAVDNWRERFD